MDENSLICRIVKARLVEEGKTLQEFRDTVVLRSLAYDVKGLRALGYHLTSQKVKKVNDAVRALKNFDPSTFAPPPKRKMSSAKRSRPAGYTYASESPAKSHPGPTFSHGHRLHLHAQRLCGQAGSEGQGCDKGASQRHRSFSRSQVQPEHARRTLRPTAAFHVSDGVNWLRTECRRCRVCHCSRSCCGLRP